MAAVNDKGGVGKTTISANLAGQTAAAGYRVLAVDLNRQANLADDLGYRDGGGVDDQGAGLLGAILAGTPLVPAPGVRPGLDVVAGGTRLTDLTPIITSRVQHHGRAAFTGLADCLAPIASRYDLIVIDSPPENTVLSDLALAAAGWVLMPTRTDSGGLVGMRLVAERFALARELNPGLRLLGVVVFGTLAAATAIHAETRADITAAFGGASPLLSASIRYSERVARQSRLTGRLAHELEVDAAAQPAWWQALRDNDSSPRIPGNVASVAGDFRSLAGEVLDVIARAETPQEATP